MNKPKTETEKPGINMIGTSTSVHGNMQTEGDLRIDGFVKGELIVKGKLVVGNSGAIEGNIRCQNADISGKVAGDLCVDELLTLHEAAYVEGNINTNRLCVEQGASFYGNCRMTKGGKEIPTESKK